MESPWKEKSHGERNHEDIVAASPDEVGLIVSISKHLVTYPDLGEDGPAEIKCSDYIQ